MRVSLIGRSGTLLAAMLLAARAVPSAADSRAPSVPHREGIWKAVVPQQPMHAELDGLDPIGVVAGARIKADCSLNWIDPDDGRRYCFASGTSLELFLLEPKACIARARAAWRRMLAGDAP